MEEEQRVETPVDEQVHQDSGATESVEQPQESPVEENLADEPVEEESGEEKECGCCSSEGTKSAEDMIRDLVNLVNVYKGEEKEGATTKIDPATADELVAKLGELAQKVSDICH